MNVTKIVSFGDSFKRTNTSTVFNQSSPLNNISFKRHHHRDSFSLSVEEERQEQKEHPDSYDVRYAETPEKKAFCRMMDFAARVGLDWDDLNVDAFRRRRDIIDRDYDPDFDDD